MKDKNEILYAACDKAARAVLWQTPEPKNLADIVDTDQISRLTQRFYKIAESYFELLETDYDVNLIARAVLYLTDIHAIPPMSEDTRWFEERLEALLELAHPNTIPTAQAARFFDDIEEGIRIAKFDMAEQSKDKTEGPV